MEKKRRKQKMKAKKSEIIFLYDLAWANPNGDPNDANKPRIDTETGLNIVTDVRLKRTIRDELMSQGYEILVRDTYDETTGNLKDGKSRAKDFLEPGKNIAKLTVEETKQLHDAIKKCIDVRLFGCTLPYEKNSVTYTGPVQFKMGYSMHPVKLEYIKGTGAFASTEGRDQKTFRQEHVLAYSLINFYGMVNPRAAEQTGLTEEDVEIMLNAMWTGTQNLISRTKVGQQPRMLLKVNYKPDDYYIGSLDKKIDFVSEKNGEEIRRIDEGTLKLEELKNVLLANKEKIDSVEIRQDSNVKTDISLLEELKNAGIPVIQK